MPPLSQSYYTVNNSKHFIEQIKYDKIPEGYQMLSFDVKSLFSGIPLNKTIEITLKLIYDRKEIKKIFRKLSWRKCYFYVPKVFIFYFRVKCTSKLAVGVAMGSPLGPILPGIFMIELEKTTLSTLANLLS